MEIGDFNPEMLVERIQTGDHDAEEELVQRYTRGVYFVIKQRVSDTSVAEDVYQETFRLSLEKIRSGELREPERLSGFICGIARNLVIDQFRRSARREGRGAPGLDQPIASPEPSPLDKLLRKEQGILARQVLAALASDRDRKVLYRFYIADDDKEEICQELGVSSLLFNQILCRARERYKKLFEEMRVREKK
jgi:RNA polymerase sigma-70 factor (ECF subfamily)